jgi:hypothetical protein
MASWTLKIRVGPEVERARFGDLGPALEALERRVEELARTTRREDVQFFRRTIEAARQVAVRAEIAGPGRILPAVRGGVDLRGDGSAEAFTGRARRELVAREAGESPYEALRRVLTGPVGRGCAP